jgi:hypothetical protein
LYHRPVLYRRGPSRRQVSQHPGRSLQLAALLTRRRREGGHLTGAGGAGSGGGKGGVHGSGRGDRRRVPIVSDAGLMTAFAPTLKQKRHRVTFGDMSSSGLAFHLICLLLASFALRQFVCFRFRCTHCSAVSIVPPQPPLTCSCDRMLQPVPTLIPIVHSRPVLERHHQPT